MLIICLLSCLACLAFSAPALAGEAEPVAVRTFPADSAALVDPGVDKIWVEFDQPMRTDSWSWCYEDKSLFPELAGQAGYDSQTGRFVLPVRLYPNKRYEIWINTDKFKNFKSINNIPARPYKFGFNTGPGS